MAQTRSFKEYVANRFYNELCAAVSEYLEENINRLDVSSYSVRTVDNAELSDIEVKAVFVDELPEMRIAFDVLLEAEFEISENDRHDDRSDTKRKWFRVCCTGDLACNLNDFAITSTNLYDTRGKQNNPLSDALVPIIKPEELESKARDFLERYYPEALYEPMPIDTDVLLKRMGLSMQPKHISDDCSIFGQIFFVGCDAQYYDKDCRAFKSVPVDAGTIFVDLDVFFLRNLGAMNNTIVHECVHWDKHRKAFELERLYNESATQIRCQVIGGIRDDKNRTATDRMEWQANALTPRIQMPYTQAKIKAAEFIREYKQRFQTNEIIDVMEPVIDEMALFFCVSRIAAKIRMIDLGYEEAIGVFTYIDGHYVKPHTCKKGSISKKQTFSVSAEDAMIQGICSLNLRESLQKGTYQFIDSHFCVNSPKYITSDMDGKPALTDYARTHMDECCVVFDLKVKATNKYGEAYYTECVLYRDASSGIVFEALYSDDNGKKNHDEMVRDYNADILDIAKKLPGSFSGALDMLIKWSGMTEEDIAWESWLSSRTVQRLRNSDDQNTTIGTVIQLCIGMSLPPPLSYKLIELSGNCLRANDLHIVYQFLITGYYSRSMEECNAILAGQNQPTLGTPPER